MSTDTQPPQPTSSAADDLPAEPPLLTADVCGFYLPGRVDEIEARWAQMVDLPLEEESRDFSLASTSTTSVTDVERDALPKLKEAILKQMGLDAVPPGFQAHHFTQWKLLCMLRARNGDVEKATARALECIASVDHVMAYARQFEAAPARLRALYQQYHPSGMFGVDKRGCPVIYGRLGRTDLAGLVREAGIGFHRQQEFYHNLLTWDVTYMQSVRRGVALQGSLFVMDVSGLTLSGGSAACRLTPIASSVAAASTTASTTSATCTASSHRLHPFLHLAGTRATRRPST